MIATEHGKKNPLRSMNHGPARTRGATSPSKINRTRAPGSETPAWQKIGKRYNKYTHYPSGKPRVVGEGACKYTGKKRHLCKPREMPSGYQPPNKVK